MDVLFINPGNSSKIYQDLANDYSAIEPPTWSLLLAQSCRSVGFEVGILDVNAERLTNQEVLNRIQILNPKLLCFVVYGQNVNAGTVNMGGATDLSKFLKENSIQIPIAFIGSHVQALPLKTLELEKSIDFVFTNEGVYSLRNILKEEKIDINNLFHIKGIGFREKNGSLCLTEVEKLVPQNLMDIDLPGYAWDLLPYKEKPFDLYRAPMWHAEYVEENRTPYVAIQTSLGCSFGCDFCMINILNRNNNDPIGVAGNYSLMRYWSPDFIIKEFDKLVDYGVKTIKITDEMFLLNPKYYIPLCEKLIERGYGKKLSMWAYSRIDTIKRENILQLVRDAGIKWLALGIESSNRKVRLEVSKGKFEDVDIKQIIKQVQDSGIEVMANYIFGLPGENFESMENTLKLGLELCTIAWNGYPAMALPGSKLYKDALDKNYELPDDYIGFSFHSYNTKPLRNEYLTSSEILKFRDEAFIKYHSYLPFLEKIEKRYGKKAIDNIQKMLEIKLKRKILDE